MFSFFEKKIYLVDYLHGFVDIHNHILPGIDDGAKNVDESIAIIKGFKEFGVKNFICTPHIMNHYYPNTPKNIVKTFELLQQELAKQSLFDIRIDYAAEHMIDDVFETKIEEELVVPIKKDYLLVEMSYLQPAFNFESAINKVVQNAYYPILAHPERYLYLDKRKYWDYKQMGVFFQLNILSLGGYYGKDVQKNSFKLLESNLFDFIGSDLHKTYHLDALKKIKLSSTALNRVLPIIENTISVFY